MRWMFGLFFLLIGVALALRIGGHTVYSGVVVAFASGIASVIVAEAYVRWRHEERPAELGDGPADPAGGGVAGDLGGPDAGQRDPDGGGPGAGGDVVGDRGGRVVRGDGSSHGQVFAGIVLGYRRRRR